jgi:hypothetical protein
MSSASGPLAFLATALSSAISVGLMMITATVLAVDSMRHGGVPASLNLAFFLLVGGTLAGVLIAAFAAWRLLAPIGSAYRRGALTIVCAFATVLLMLICIPVNQVLGRTGLLVLLGLFAIAAVILARRARRLGANS